MPGTSMRAVALTAVLAALVVVPSHAQSRWENDAPVVIGLVDKDLLFTIAPPTFSGCNEGLTAVWLEGMPKLGLWSGFLSLDPGAPLWNMHWVTTPFGALNITWNNDAWIRVFRVQGDDLAWYQARPCEFYGAHPYVAQGPGFMNFHSADDGLNGPGANSWGYTLRGTLDGDGYCPGGGPVRLTWLQRWVSLSQTDFTVAKSTSSRGPTLACR